MLKARRPWFQVRVIQNKKTVLVRSLNTSHPKTAMDSDQFRKAAQASIEDSEFI